MPVSSWSDELVEWDDELTRETDHIQLGLVEPWLDSHPLPEGVEAPHPSRLRMGQDAFIARRHELAAHRFAFATFAGCDAFSSRPEFAEAAAHVLDGTPAIYVYHNRNTLSELLELFPRTGRITLKHDLSDSDEGLVYATRNEPHHLAHLEGNFADHEDTGLAVYGDAVTDLLVACPNLRLLAADILPALDAAQENNELRSVIGNLLVVVLGGYAYGHDGGVESFVPASADQVKRAAEMCPDAGLVYLAVDSPDPVQELTEFNAPSKLCVSYEPVTTAFCPFSSVVPALKKFDLSALTLKNFKDVDLNKVAKTGEKTLRLLSLDHCHVLDEEVKSSAFRNLVALTITWATPVTLQCLLSECPELEYLKLGSTEVSRMFLSRVFPKTSLTSLRSLELRLDHPLEHHGLGEEDLNVMVESLPSLGYVSTNSAEVRLFLRRSAPHVRIGTLFCALCAAEFCRRTGKCSVSSIL
ncbi:uncharacterized protein [Dermacentor andersoni]|uniref:uncharacterized protein n=1 Tax=Dermacentor andersoni TaxID=34620 RepID=UPI0021550D7D|nr:uncharacterized protein LOC126544389 [Dermacentor andersoni]